MQVSTKDVTISDGSSLSGAAKLDGMLLIGLRTDSAWDSNVITFQVGVSNDVGGIDETGTSFLDVYEQDGTEAQAGSSSSITADSHVTLDPALFAGFEYVKVRSGTSGSAQNQSGDTVVTLVLTPG